MSIFICILGLCGFFMGLINLAANIVQQRIINALKKEIQVLTDATDMRLNNLGKRIKKINDKRS